MYFLRNENQDCLCFQLKLTLIIISPALLLTTFTAKFHNYHTVQRHLQVSGNQAWVQVLLKVLNTYYYYYYFNTMQVLERAVLIVLELMPVGNYLHTLHSCVT